MLALVLVALLAFGDAAYAKCGIPTTPRSTAPRLEFMRKTGHPHGWPGHIVDHVMPLCKGGPDSVTNMQWQTVAEAKAKDKWECKCEVPRRK